MGQNPLLYVHPQFAQTHVVDWWSRSHCSRHIARRKRFRMDNPSQSFQPLDDPWPGTIQDIGRNLVQPTLLDR